MDMNKVRTVSLDRPDFSNGATTKEHWVADHSAAELASITAKLQEMFDAKKLENTRGTTTVEEDGRTSVSYKFIDSTAANEYVEFINAFQPASIEIVS